MEKVAQTSEYKISLPDIKTLIIDTLLKEYEKDYDVTIEPVYTRRDYDGPGVMDRDISGFRIVVNHPIEGT